MGNKKAPWRVLGNPCGGELFLVLRPHRERTPARDKSRSSQQ